MNQEQTEKSVKRLSVFACVGAAICFLILIIAVAGKIFGRA